MVAVSELKAENWVAYIFRSPGGEKKVDIAELRQVNRPIAPAVRVIGLGAVVTVAKVVDGDRSPLTSIQAVRAVSACQSPSFDGFRLSHQVSTIQKPAKHKAAAQSRRLTFTSTATTAAT